MERPSTKAGEDGASGSKVVLGEQLTVGVVLVDPATGKILLGEASLPPAYAYASACVSVSSGCSLAGHLLTRWSSVLQFEEGEQRTKLRTLLAQARPAEVLYPKQQLSEQTLKLIKYESTTEVLTIPMMMVVVTVMPTTPMFTSATRLASRS